ncbi:hypothetical protein IE53DRAFT_269574 [Violaceomyces palustris]|uniref:Uncharacterized protein n=1 Tax=Violaceomyces palustris TaxID=1673888 RepID=A0ACD0NMW1_9BASI|nr:hypothetical protein IE53DRAFT_269574 [Violaceomyces palustris]
MISLLPRTTLLSRFPSPSLSTSPPHGCVLAKRQGFESYHRRLRPGASSSCEIVSLFNASPHPSYSPSALSPSSSWPPLFLSSPNILSVPVPPSSPILFTSKGVGSPGCSRLHSSLQATQGFLPNPCPRCPTSEQTGSSSKTQHRPYSLMCVLF